MDQRNGKSRILILYSISPCIMSVQYTGGMQYTGGCSVHWGISLSTPGVFSTLGDIMSTPEVSSTMGGYYEDSGGYHDECGGYHEYTLRYSAHWGFHTDSIVFPMTFPTFIMISLIVLMISPSVLNIPRCTAHLGVLHRHYAG